MNFFHLRSMLKEFPFLRDVLAKDDIENAAGIESVVVKRINLEMLGWAPFRRFELNGTPTQFQFIYFVYPDSVVRLGNSTNDEQPVPTVGEVLGEEGRDVDTMTAIVVVYHDCSWTPTTVTIAKPAKGWTLSGWVAQQRQEATAATKLAVAEAGV